MPLHRECGVSTGEVWGFFLINALPEAHGCGGGLVTQSSPTLATPWAVACQAPPPMGFSRQEYWSGLPYRPIIFFLCDILVFGIRVMVSS